MKEDVNKLTKTELRVRDLWLANQNLAQIALQTGKTIAQVATIVTKIQKQDRK